MTNGKIIYLRLLNYSRKYWAFFLSGLLGTIIASGIDASFAWLIKPLLDKGFVHQDINFIRFLPFILILAFLFRNGGNFLSNYYMALTGRSVVTQFRKDLFAHYIKLPAYYLDNTTSGLLLSKLIYNVEQVAKAGTTAIVTVVQESCFISGLIIVMFINSWQLSLLFMGIAPVIAFIARQSSKKMRHLSSNIQNSMSGVTQLTEESLEGYRVIRAFGAQAYEVHKFNQLVEDNRDREMKTVATDALATSAVQLMIAVLISGTVYIATVKLTHITAGTFVSIITAMLAMLKPVRNLTTVNSVIQKGIAGADSLFEILDQPLESDSGTALFTHPVKGHILLENISFSYDFLLDPFQKHTSEFKSEFKSELKNELKNELKTGYKKVLDNISFEILPGKTVALVGKSGSGKSTLASLLLRFYDNYQGCIKIDNINIRELSLENLRMQIAVVSQQITLFNDTIRNNLAYGYIDKVSEADIIEAAKASNAWEFIQALPEGLNTRVGENGVLLSGGQRQRLAIGRALLKNAPILIMDEATSALDTASERAIQTALEKLIKNRTTLIIAHRLSTIENADHILVMDQGKIIESGTHHTLLLSKGHYAHLHQKHDDKKKENF